MKLLFCNVGWMKNYDGIHGDSLHRGGAFNEHAIGHEVCNFTDVNGRVFGYVRSSGKIDIKKLGAKKGDDYVDGITVVWTAGPDSGGTAIVGWYTNARIYTEPQKILNGSKTHRKNKLDFYLIEADFANAYLIPEQQRTFLIPRAVKGGIGQSNVWYAQSDESKSIVQRVYQYINNIDQKEDLFDVDQEAIGLEGNPRFRTHLIRERNKKIIREKKNIVLKQFGTLACEVCRFDFKKNYGEIGENFCEIHHLIPLNQADGVVETTLDDLAVVCSNCHRMLHQGNPLLKLGELKKIINKNLKI